MVVGAILKSDEKTPGLLQKNITYSQNEVDRSGYSPITKQHVNEGMSISGLSQAALEHTDNTAMNLLIKQMGGTKLITSFARSINDNFFRLDRLEPELNTAIPGDLRDTTTPKAMGNSLQGLALGNILATKQRNLLTTWLKITLPETIGLEQESQNLGLLAIKLEPAIMEQLMILGSFGHLIVHQ